MRRPINCDNGSQHWTRLISSSNASSRDNDASVCESTIILVSKWFTVNIAAVLASG